MSGSEPAISGISTRRDRISVARNAAPFSNSERSVSAILIPGGGTRRTLSGRLSDGPSARSAQASEQEDTTSRMGKRMRPVCDENRATWQEQIAPASAPRCTPKLSATDRGIYAASSEAPQDGQRISILFPSKHRSGLKPAPLENQELVDARTAPGLARPPWSSGDDF